MSVGDDELMVISVPVSRTPAWELLTEAEVAVATLAVAGESNAAIARVRGTSPRTIANQLASIYQKVGVSSRTELATLLTPAGDTPPDDVG